MGGPPITMTQPIVVRWPNETIFATQPQTSPGQTTAFFSQDPNRPGTYTMTGGVNMFSPPLTKIKSESDTDNPIQQVIVSEEQHQQQQQLTIVTTPQIIPPNSKL